MVTKKEVENCQIDPDKMFDAIMRKWSIIILKDMFLGAKRFNDFREMNPKISGKVLSDQLKNLEKYGFIKKVVVSTTPIKCEYHLTDMGCPSIVIGIPTRHIHAHNGILDLEDVKNAIKLIVELIKRLDKATVDSFTEI